MNSWYSIPLRVTNLEKTGIDMLKIQNATPGLVDEMVGDYLSREDKDIERLKVYGKRFNVESIINKIILNNTL